MLPLEIELEIPIHHLVRLPTLVYPLYLAISLLDMCG